MIDQSGLFTQVSESGTPDSYTIVLASRPTATVTVSVIPDGQVRVNGTSAAVVLTFDPTLSSTATGAWNRAQTVQVTAVQDAFDEDDPHQGTITHQVSGYVGAEALTVTVIDRTPPAVVVSSSSVDVTEGAATSSFAVTLSTAPAATVSVTISGVVPEQLQLGATVLQFTPANWNVAQSVSVSGLIDDSDDGNLTVGLTLSASSADLTFAVIPTVPVSVLVRDIDTAAVVISRSSGSTQVSESGATVSYTVVLASRPEKIVTVSAIPDGQVLVNGTPAALVLTFDPSLVAPQAGAWNQPQTVVVSAVQDAFDEPDLHQGTITHQVIDYGGVTAETIAVDVIDRIPPGLLLTPTTGETDEDGTPFVFTVALTTAPSAPVTVSLSLPLDGDNADELALDTTTLTFTPLDWSATQAVSVIGQADDVQDVDATVPVVLTLSSLDPTFTGLPQRQVVVINRDLDVSELVISESDTDTRVSETGITDTYGLRLSSRPSGTVAVVVLADAQLRVNGATTALVVFDGSLSAPATGAWNVAQTVVVSAAVDVFDENNPHQGIITHTVSGFGLGAAPTLTVVVADNDPPQASSTTSFAVGRSGSAAITTAIIDASDDDTLADALVFTLILAPGQGDLVRDPGPGQEILEIKDTFTRADLVAGRIWYVNAGTPQGRDGFAFQVADAVGNKSALGLLEFGILGFITPSISLGGDDLVWTEDDPPLALDVGTVVEDPDSPYFKLLTVTISAGADAADRVSVRNQGLGAGQIGVVDDQVLFSGNPIATLSGGVGANPLVVAFNPDVAGVPAVTALIQNLIFSSQTQAPSDTQRALQVVLRDGSDLDSPTVTRRIDVVKVNDPPRILGPLIIQTSQGVAVANQLLASDPDSYPLTVTVTSIPGKGVLSGLISTTGTGSTLADATSTTGFTYTPSPGQSGSDTFTVQVRDPFGAVTTLSIPVVITGGEAVRPWFVSDPPLVAFAGTPLSYDIRLDFRDLAQVPDPGELSFALVGTLPAGVVNGGITPDPADPTRATLTLAIDAAATGVIQVGLIVSETANTTTGFQPMTVVIVPAGTGGG